MCWYPKNWDIETDNNKLDQIVEEKIKELDAVLSGDVSAGIYACDIEASCFPSDLPQVWWSLNGLTTRFSQFCEENPRVQLAQIHGLKNLTYVSSKNTISPLHIEDGDLWSVNYHWRGAPKLWVLFEYTDLQKYVDAVQKDLDGKSHALIEK